MKYQVTRLSNRGRVMRSALPSVLDAQVPFEVVVLLEQILEEGKLSDSNRNLPEAASIIRRIGRNRNRNQHELKFETCAPAQVDKPRRKKLVIPQRVGMLWFFLKKEPHKVIQFVGTLGMCRERIRLGT
jgi:hypothetical protein